MAVIECDNCGAVIPDRAVGDTSRFGVAWALCPDCSATGNYEVGYEPIDPDPGLGFGSPEDDEAIQRYITEAFDSRAVVQDEEDAGREPGDRGALQGKTASRKEPDKGLTSRSTDRNPPTTGVAPRIRRTVKSPARTRRPTKPAQRRKQ